MSRTLGTCSVRLTDSVTSKLGALAGKQVPPEPPTSIFIVPFGPRLVLITSSNPLAALMFMKRAADRPMTSAFGLRVLRLDMLTK